MPSDNERKLFHQMVAKALFLCKRARPDIQPIVTLLCMRVKKPGKSDWNKLVRMMKFLNSKVNDKLILSARNGVSNIEWYIDAAFAVHPDFRSHTGATQHFKDGKGATQSISAKQKLNTYSSAIAESVVVGQPLPLVVWAPSFLAEQGCSAETNCIY